MRNEQREQRQILALIFLPDLAEVLIFLLFTDIFSAGIKNIK
jgi:hypothetical protein